MTSRPPSLAMRELRAHLGAPMVLATQAGIALILGVSGPFGTLDALPLAPRLLYWTGIVFGTYGLGSALCLLALDTWPARGGAPMRLLRDACALGAMVVTFLALWNLPFFGGAGLLGHLSAQSLIGAFLVSGVVVVLRDMRPRAAQADQRPPLLDRLPLEKRGSLVALSATDHYVEVITTAGRALILMRLADAIRETEPVHGLQVHRSHWVALAQVRAVTRRGDGAVLDMGAGVTIPVSRRYMPEIRMAGLLTRKESA